MPRQKRSVKKTDLDSPWKGILDLYFQDFVALCWPDKYELFDWARGFKMLDKDLLKIAKGASIGNRSVDKLIEVYLLNGESTYLILHLEIQGSAQVHFEKRMFQYRYRLMDLYDKPVASLAILIDANPSWRPHRYYEEVLGSTVEMVFPFIKISDYQDRITALQTSKNRFAPVILAQLALNRKEAPEARLETKFELTRNLYKLGWVAKDIRALYKFIDWIITLPPELDLVYNEKVLKVEEELGVHYVTTAERIGIQKGIEQGMQQGEFVIVLSLMEEKFKDVPDLYKDKISQMDAHALIKLARQILYSQSLEELFKS